MDEASGVPAPRWRAAHDALDRDGLALIGVLADRGRITAHLEEVEARARRFESRDDGLRFLDESYEATRREWFAVNEVLDEVQIVRAACLADYRAGRKHAEQRCRAVAASLLPEMSGEEKEALEQLLGIELWTAVAEFDEKYTELFLGLRERVRSWLDRYDPTGVWRRASLGAARGAWWRGRGGSWVTRTGSWLGRYDGVR